MTAIYGTNISITAPANVGANWTIVAPSANPTSGMGTAVVSPITAACSACHDSQVMISHMTNNGGVFYGDRAKVATNGNLVSNEQCLICHGSGAVADIKAVHMNFK